MTRHIDPVKLAELVSEGLSDRELAYLDVSRNAVSNWINDRVGELAAEALPAPWTLHTLRHRFASRAYDATGDLVTVSRLLGHASVATTQRYVATGRARLREVAGAAA